MISVKEEADKIKNNLLGAIAGGIVFYYATSKMAKNVWVIGGLTFLGIYAGATIQKRYKAKQSTPTAKTIQ